MQTICSLALSLMGVGAVAIAIRRFRSEVRHSGDQGLACAVAVFASSTNMVSFLLPGRSSIPLAIVIAGFAAYGLSRMQPSDVFGGADPLRRKAWYVYGIIVIWCFAVDLLSAGGIYGDRFLTYGAAVLSWVAVGAVMARFVVSAQLMAYVGVFLLGLMTAPTALAAETFWRECTVGDLEKCSIAGSLFKSFPASENYVAIQASFVLSLAVIGLRGRDRLFSGALCLLIIVATGSRTAFIALAVGLAWFVVAHVFARGRSGGRTFSLSMSVCASVALACVVIPLYLVATATVSSFSRRGAIWLAVDDYIEGRDLVGVGLSKWDLFRTLGGSPQHFFHSTYVLALFAGGFVGLVLLALWTASILRGRVETGDAPLVKLPVVVLAVYCITEVAWNPLAVDGFTWLALTCMLLARGTSRPNRDSVERVIRRHSGFTAR